MDSIYKIYDNTIGISFRWKQVKSNLTQIIFRDTGFHLTTEEIEFFIDKVCDAKMQKPCKSCELSGDCRSVLLQTPSDKVSMAVNYEELGQIEDLLRGTLFQIRMNNYLNDLCKN
ncbi:conserved hypothetical protein [Tenacibaculum litopenaei]|jgi:hypothetical protein|uniref:hypothetical protein n=1 Tax=Tenacibaculum litopenaei TaxID=396016 RepID=UPI0038945623